MHDIRARHETARTPLVISGAIGPRGDGYDPGALMSPWEAEAYHAWQIGVFADAGADLVSAFTLTNVNEAIGVTRAAKAAGMPCVISFTLETDGLLPTGESLAAAIESVDRETDRGPAYYMINCAHPDHFRDALDRDAAWMKRCAACGRTPREKVTPSSTIRPSSTPAIPKSSARSMPDCSAASRTSTCSEAAAAPTTAMWRASRPRAAAPRRAGSGAVLQAAE